MKKIMILMVISMFVSVGFASLVSAEPDDPVNPNRAPSMPEIIQDKSGWDKEVYQCTFCSLDPENDIVYYEVKCEKLTTESIWSMEPDDPVVPWLGPYDSGDEVTEDLKFKEKGTYKVTIRAKDIHENISPSATITISYSKNKISQFPILDWILQKFPRIYDLVQGILQF